MQALPIRFGAHLKKFRLHMESTEYFDNPLVHPVGIGASLKLSYKVTSILKMDFARIYTSPEKIQAGEEDTCDKRNTN